MSDFLINSCGIIGKDFSCDGTAGAYDAETLSDLAGNLDAMGVKSRVQTDGNVYDLTRDLGYGREIVADIDSSWFSMENLGLLLSDLFDYERPDLASLVGKLNLDNPDAPAVTLINPLNGKSNDIPMDAFMESVGGAHCDYLHTEDVVPDVQEQFQINGWDDNHIPKIGNVDFHTFDKAFEYYDENLRVSQELLDPMNWHTDGHGSFDIELWMAERGFEPGSREGLEALALFAEPPIQLPEKPIEANILEMMGGMPSPQQIALRASAPDLFDDDSTPISAEAINDMADREASMLEKADHAESMGHFSAAASLRNSAHELGDIMDSGHWD